MAETIIPVQHVFYPVWQIVYYIKDIPVAQELICCAEIVAKKEVSSRFDTAPEYNKTCLFMVYPNLQTKLIKTCERTISEKVEQ